MGDAVMTSDPLLLIGAAPNAMDASPKISAAYRSAPASLIVSGFEFETHLNLSLPDCGLAGRTTRSFARYLGKRRDFIVDIIDPKEIHVFLKFSARADVYGRHTKECNFGLPYRQVGQAMLGSLQPERYRYAKQGTADKDVEILLSDIFLQKNPSGM